MILVWACLLWVFASTICALLPMRRQFVPGVILMAVAPVLILWIGWATHWVFGLAALAAFVSMFRNPLRYLWARLRGERPEVPK